jgi:hypothetical protein
MYETTTDPKIHLMWFNKRQLLRIGVNYNEGLSQSAKCKDRNEKGTKFMHSKSIY